MTFLLFFSVDTFTAIKVYKIEDTITKVLLIVKKHFQCISGMYCVAMESSDRESNLKGVQVTRQVRSMNKISQKSVFFRIRFDVFQV